MVTILTKQKTRLRVKQVELPISDSVVLGSGIDVTSLPDGHLSCVRCQSPFFECWVYLDERRLEMGCVKCNTAYRVLFPMDVSLTPFKNYGRFSCKKHPEKAMVLIKNQETVSIGCQCCYSEVQIKLRSKSNLVLADG